MLHFTSVL